MCQKSLAYLSSTDGAAYRDQRLKDTWKSKGSKGPGRLIKPSTIRRQVNILHNIFEVARTEWGLTNLINPFAGLKIKAREIDGEVFGTNFRRTRRLEDGELERLFLNARNGCRGKNRFLVPLAMYLAIETGMRLQEIFNLKWSDIQGRRIKIRKSKTDHVNRNPGRTIVMTQRAMFIFMSAKIHNKTAKDEKVFSMTKTAFAQSCVML
jgi:integrase